MKEKYLLGGYTRRKNQGLALIEYNPQQEKFLERQVFSSLQNPTYLALSVDHRYLFSIEKESPLSGVSVFKKDTFGQWEKKDQFLHTKTAGCHLFYLDQTRTLYLSNYHEGTLEIYHLNTKDQLEHIETIAHEGSSIHPNQTQSRIHFSSTLGQDKHLYVCDLGSDNVLIYALTESGTIHHLQQTLSLPRGTGPRHLAIHPDLPYVYIIGELNNTTTLCKLNQEGHLRIIENYPNIEGDSNKDATGAAIKCSKDGRFIYVSTRYQDQISLFAVNKKTGQLSLIESVSSAGKVPRDFCFSQNENYLMVAHQDSDNLALFRRNLETGKLTLISKETYAPECVCIINDPS
ncbi:lactonase family protein [Facklamia miroungae]|uniref:6-phosphogluconolactonase n=1 Tax=Facklamia miroungae TaxID=120956 RepID=A0A1G7QW54_9LACT|nr:lactonase family protein [Facklamia miroungae]NKZ29086.1 lactonase family protein [Facklamia miroungae]SDG02737.1 6-phosphogluconolactonase [Facklamia miroungae]